MSLDNDTAYKPLVLIADDDPTHQLIVQAILTKAGYRVLAAPNGKVVLDMFADEQPDIVLLDCKMPGLDGYQATQAIRQLESQGNEKAIPIIAVTGNTSVGDQEKCTSAGMNDLLGKPFTGKQLKAVLAQHLVDSETIPAGKVAVAEESGMPSVDSSVLGGLSKLQQEWGQDLVKRLVQVYLQSSRKLVAKLRSAIESADAESIGADAHALRSSSAKVGAVKLADLCGTLGTAGRQGDLSSASALQQQIQREYEQVIKALMASESTS